MGLWSHTRHPPAVVVDDVDDGLDRVGQGVFLDGTRMIATAREQAVRLGGA
jgi:hypothetical protein